MSKPTDAECCKACITGSAAETIMRIARELRKNVSDASKSCQAQPVYYGIIDREAVVTQEGYGDFYEWYDEMNCEALSDEELKERMAEYAEIHGGNINGWGQDIVRQPMRWVSFVVRDRVFLTRDAAEQHLKDNHYHYSDWAHTYAMTAWRSPQYEELVDCLLSFADEEEAEK